MPSGTVDSMVDAGALPRAAPVQGASQAAQSLPDSGTTSWQAAITGITGNYVMPRRWEIGDKVAAGSPQCGPSEEAPSRVP
ncbi:MAG: hypothetical protein EON58_00980 [Alphaproteobacteria bacterium]|nr:MAG: hypothetical protein EON58_00980 [Alphaproteobacteria bacterium]